MNQLIMILLVSMLVLVHEFGHFLAAKACGVRVTRFGIGMPLGPSWKIFKIGYTTFYLHACLFGGYVAFADEEPELKPQEETKNETDDDDEDEEFEDNKKKIVLEEHERLPKDSPELYQNKTIGQKLLIVSAGVIMNVIFAVVLVMFCAIVYQKLPITAQHIFVKGFTDKVTSNAKEMGLREGDQIVKINDVKIISLYQLLLFAGGSKRFDDFTNEELIEKNYHALKKLNPDLKGKNSLLFKTEVVKLPKTLAEAPLELHKDVLQGISHYKKTGIELTSEQKKLRNKLYGKSEFVLDTNETLENIAIALSDTYKPLTLTIIRDGKEMKIENIAIDTTGFLGIKPRTEDAYDFIKKPSEVITKSCKYLYTTTGTMLYSLWQLFTGKVNASDMHGVIAVVKVGGDIIETKGMLNGILLTATISINLAIMNFLPIPALDGGHVMFLLIEKLTGRRPTQEQSEKINNFFFILLIVLMLSICYNDILALVTKKF